MQQIADWLEKLGLGQYAQRFAENEIDVSVLRHLTDQDLKDIGIPLGHRRKMLAAIAELPVRRRRNLRQWSRLSRNLRHGRTTPSHCDVLRELYLLFNDTHKWRLADGDAHKQF